MASWEERGLTIILFCIDLCSVLICLTSSCYSSNVFDSDLNLINAFIILKVRNEPFQINSEHNKIETCIFEASMTTRYLHT